MKSPLEAPEKQIAEETSAKPQKPTASVIAFYVMGILFASLLCAATVCLIMALLPREKAFVASPSAQMEYVRQLTEYHSTSDDLHDTEAMVERDFRAAFSASCHKAP